MPIDKAGVVLPGIAQPIELYTLQQSDGIRARILTLGGAVMTLEVPDRDGRLADIVLGFDEPARYLANPPFLGTLIGRYGNRIARGQLLVDGSVFQLATNDGPNHLHGGPGGFHMVPWEVRAVDDGRGDNSPRSRSTTSAATARRAIRGRWRSMSSTR